MFIANAIALARADVFGVVSADVLGVVGLGFFFIARFGTITPGSCFADYKTVVAEKLVCILSHYYKVILEVARQNSF
jgi:hypothetical protein